jgi:predicted Zn-dependent protease
MSKYFSLITILFVALFIAGCGKKDAPKPEAPKADSSAGSAQEPGVAGETFTNEAAQVSVALPESWMYETADGSITAYPKEGGFVVHFNTLKVDQLDAALTEVDKMLESEVKDLKLGDAKEYDVNGMKGQFVEGTADGVLLAVGVVDTPVENTSLMIGAWGAPESVKKYEKEILWIFQNVKQATK